MLPAVRIVGAEVPKVGPDCQQETPHLLQTLCPAILISCTMNDNRRSSEVLATPTRPHLSRNTEENLGGMEMTYKEVPLEDFVKAYMDPKVIHDKMIHIGFFMFAFEQLRSAIHERPQSFFADEWSIVEGEIRTNRTHRFKEQVLSLAKKEFEASLRWHVAHGAITENDLQDILSLLAYRNLLAHEPHKIMDIRLDYFQPDASDRVRHYHFKIGNFWAQVDIDSNPDFDGVEMDRERARSLQTDILDYYARVVAMPIVFEETAPERRNSESR